MTYNKEDKILIIGAGGQIGIELVQELSLLYGSSNVIAADLKPIPALDNNPFETLDILDKDAF
jgi:dTDP-4-dehydrorhamnose reductase